MGRSRRNWRPGLSITGNQDAAALSAQSDGRPSLGANGDPNSAGNAFPKVRAALRDNRPLSFPFLRLHLRVVLH